MGEFKKGDKFVLEIGKVFGDDSEKLYRTKGFKSLVFDGRGLNILRRLTEFTTPLEEKIKNQATEIANLRSQNEELKKKLTTQNSFCDSCDQNERVTGQNEAWELIRKLFDMERDKTIEQAFNGEFTTTHSVVGWENYHEVSVRIAEWENRTTKDEKIKTEDDIKSIGEDSNIKFQVTFTDGIDINGITCSVTDKLAEFIDKLTQSESKETKKENKINKIHYKGSYGYEYLNEYDDNGNMIHYRDSDGYEYWKEYNDKGNVIYYKNSNGFEYWNEYDDKGNIIHSKDSDGYEYWKEYDDNGNIKDLKEYYKGNLIHSKNSNGFEYWNEYDDKGNLIYYKNSNGFEYWKEYDDKGNAIHYKNSNGFEYWNEYDDNDNVIYYKDSDGYEFWKECDDNGNMTHYKDSNGYEVWNEYDNRGIVIHRKESNGYEYWGEYDDLMKSDSL